MFASDGKCQLWLWLLTPSCPLECSKLFASCQVYVQNTHFVFETCLMFLFSAQTILNYLFRKYVNSKGYSFILETCGSACLMVYLTSIICRTGWGRSALSILTDYMCCFDPKVQNTPLSKLKPFLICQEGVLAKRFVLIMCRKNPSEQ